MSDHEGSSSAKVTRDDEERVVLRDTGEILSDKRRNGKERPWAEYKSQSLIYAAALKRIGYDKKSDRVLQCGNFLIFQECLSGHEKRLSSAYFCGDRFCMPCTWRKSLKISANVYKVAHVALDRHPTYRLLILTLTIPNTAADELRQGVDILLKGWDRLVKRVEVNRAISGYFRALETTYNVKDDTWHPHIHSLLFVPAGYFKKDYIKHNRWLEMWRESTRIPSITQVDIRPVKNKGNTHETLASAAAEVAKYAVKPAPRGKDHPYIRETEPDTDAAIEQLISGLKGRRLTQFGGILREIHKELNLADEPENDDLVHIDEDSATASVCSVCGKPYTEHLYKWDKAIENYMG
jgi:plasmid rolling circle replication initiator protein Rep